MEYTITGRYIQSLEVVGYYIRDNKTSKEKLLKTQDVIKLAKLNKVNAELLECDGKEYLYIADEKDIENIFESKNKMNLQYKLADIQGNITGYNCINDAGKNFRFEPSKFWEVAYNGMIENVRAIVCNGTKAIVGDGIHLSRIETLDE